MKRRKGVIIAICGLLVWAGLFIFSGCTEKEKEAGGNKEIVWSHSVDEALAEAAESGKPLMIDFMATWYPPCKKMEDSTFVDKRVIEKSGSFHTVRIDVDKQEEVAKKYNGNASKYGGIGIPNLLFLDSNGEKIAHPVGYKSPDQLIALMDSVLAVQ